MTLSLIVAMTDDNVIGRNNQLPWHLPEDLFRFKRLTMGHPIIMGRKTYESIGKPLPGRSNIVVTRNPTLKILGVNIVDSFKSAIEMARQAPGGDEVFVIGGSSLFEEALPNTHKIYLTRIHHKIKGDVRFPAFNLEKDFDIIEKSEHLSANEDNLSFSFLTAVRKSQK